MKTIKTGSDFSGVGAFDHAMSRIQNIQHKRIFACDMDKYARKAYIAAHGEPAYYPENVYDREIPSESLDIFVTSPPCQSFSLAGKRKGENDKRGILFYNSHEFIQQNLPRFFIFENVKGLLSDNSGKTFQNWIDLLAGKSINGNNIFFPRPDTTPYHVYYKVLNAKHYGVPQNRERIFIIGIRDDQDNQFSWPKEEPLKKKLKDILEESVDQKYFLSDKMVNQLLANGKETDHLIPGDYSNTLRVGGGGSLTEKHHYDMIKVVGNTNPSGNGMNGNVFDEDGISPTLSTNKGEGIKIKSATSKGYETATVNDSINFSVPNSETRHGRVGKEVAQTLDTQCNQGVIQLNPNKESGWNRQPFCCIPVLTPDRPKKLQNGRRFKEDGDPSFTLTAQDKHGVFDGYRIRRLTPIECFRLMDFPDSHVQKCKEAGISDSQLYKQAGNSIVVRVLELIVNNLKL